MFRPNYQITNVLLNNIAQIEACKQLIFNSPLLPYWERRFQQEALTRTVHHSTHIEDNPLSYKQVSQILSGKSELDSSRVRGYKEIVNYRNVINYIDEEFSEETTRSLSKKELMKVHRILTKDILPKTMSGIVRMVPVVLVNSKTKKVSYRAPKPENVPVLLDDLFKWVNSSSSQDIHAVIRAGILHTQIAIIHPFVEANGRTARAMATLSLYKDGYDIRRFFCLEEHYDRDLHRYYEALRSVSENRGDMTIWLEYFSEGLKEELEVIKKKVLNVSRDYKMKNTVGQIMLTDRQLDVLTFIQEHGFINNERWRDRFRKYSDDTILRDLKVLIENKLVKKEGKTKAAKYILK